MKRTKINALLALDKTPGKVLIKGWVRTKRTSKNFLFMEINDGSCLKNIQVIAADDTFPLIIGGGPCAFKQLHGY